MTRTKECVKYFIMAGVILLCLYSNAIADLFIPIFDDVYYGNLVKMFVAITSAIIWGLEIGVIIFATKKLGVKMFADKPARKKELQRWQVYVLFLIAIIPMLVISACIGWKVKIVYSLGVRVTSVGLVCNVCEILAYGVRMVLMIMFIACIQQGFEKIFKTYIPFGAIFAFLTFGLIDFFVLAMDLRAFYLIVSLLYGIIYMLSNRKFVTTWALCYLIYLL